MHSHSQHVTPAQLAFSLAPSSTTLDPASVMYTTTRVLCGSPYTEGLSPAAVHQGLALAPLFSTPRPTVYDLDDHATMSPVGEEGDHIFSFRT